MRGPPITIRCDCGESRFVRYGERWECPKCGRRWNTKQIPAGEYEGFVRDLRRFRLEAFALALGLGGALLAVALVVNQALILLIPLVLGGVAIFYGPIWKKRVRRRLAARPKWELHPE